MKTLFSAFLLLSLLCSGIKAQTDSPLVSISVTDNEYPVFDASTSAQPLQMVIGCRILNIPYEWEKRIKENFVYVSPDVPEERKNNMHAKNRTSGTHGAYTSLINSEADIILVARLPSEDENREASGKGVVLDYKPVAIDAFVFLVNSSNPIQSLTTEEIREIYSGKFTNWSEVGGVNAVINAYTRGRNSGSEELMEKLVMKGLPIIKGPKMEVSTMAGPFNVISGDSMGIGYSVYFYQNYIADNRNISKISVDGVFPDYETLKSRTYPLTADVYAVIRNDTDKNSAAYRIYEWLTTEEGQRVVKESRYVPVN